MDSKLLVVIGSGPGIGVTTALQFASKGFNIALLSRNEERLREDAAKVQTASNDIVVRTYVADTSNPDTLQKALKSINDDLGPPEVVLFNAARIAPTTIGETTPDVVLEDFKSMNLGLYVTASWALPHMVSLVGKENAYPSFFLSGGGINARPVASLFSLSMQKAAQHNFMESFRIVAEPQGVHVGIVNIGGVVTDQDAVINARKIASTYWDLYQQEKNEWKFEVKIGDINDMIRDLAAKGVY